MKNFFYFGTIRKTIIQFLDIFKDIKIAKYNDSGEINKYVEVPVKFMPKQKWYSWLEHRTHEKRFPSMGIQINNIEYDQSRHTGKHEDIALSINNSDVQYYQNPVPYNIVFQVRIATNYVSEMDQIIEQILPYCSPYVVNNIKIDELDLDWDINIKFDSLEIDQEIDIEIIQMLKNDIFSTAVFWENDTIDQDLTAELILKYWDLEPVQSYPENDYYQILMQFADNKITLIDQKIADFWFDFPAAVIEKLNELIEEGKLDFENYLIYLQIKDNKILNSILLNFIKEAAEESQESINNLFEKFHYQLIDELTKSSLEKDEKINLTPIIPHADSERSEFDLQSELEMKDYSLLEIFDHYSIEIDFEALNLFSENSLETLSDYLKTLVTHIDYLNEMREKLKCGGCGQMMNYDLDYSSKYAAYKVESAHCNNLECWKFDQEIIF